RPAWAGGTGLGDPRPRVVAAPAPPVRGEVVGGGRAHRAGDVAGPRVDRLDLAPVALARAGVEQHTGAGERGRAVGVEDGQVPAGQLDVTGFRLGPGTGLEGAPARGPGAEA